MNNTDRGKIFKLITAIIFLLIAVFWGLHAGDELNTNPSCESIIDALIFGIVSLFKAPLSLNISFNTNTLTALGCTLIVYAIVILILLLDEQRHKHYDRDTACGSAQWNKDLKAYNKKYSDPVDSKKANGPNNMILTSKIFLNLDGHITHRNNNVTVVGGSGSGKTRYFIKPNILQANCNYVITDPKGDLLKTTGKFLEDQGYEVKVFNLVEMWKSDCYNPFDYIRDDLGVVMMIKCLIKNTTPPGQKASDPFWEKSEEALLQALCFYLVHHREKKYRNFTTVMKLLRLAEVDERNPGYKSHLDKLFDDVERIDPNSIALKQYKTFKMGAGKTLKSILISCSVRLTVFNLSQIENLTGKDTIGLDKMGEGKKALFVIIPSADSTYNFLVSMMYSQLFETLYYMAETQYENNRLKSRVRFLLDEFANIGEIPEFTKKLATMRQYEISCSIVLQNLAQIKSMYKDDWPSILGNCDSFLFLGGQEFETVDYISKELGDQTIISKNRSMSHGKSANSSQSYQVTSRKLMTPDELIHMEEDECVLMIRALNPFKTKKYNYTKHPNYKYTGDYSKENLYVNKKDNRVFVSQEEIDIAEERRRVEAFRQAAENPSPSTKVIGEIKNIEGLTKTLNLTPENVKERLVVITPTPGPIINSPQDSSTSDDADSSIKDIPLSNEEVPVHMDTVSNGGETDSVEDPQGKDAPISTEESQEDIVSQSENKPVEKRTYSGQPSEKTLMKREKISPGSPVLFSSESEQEIWDFDPQ